MNERLAAALADRYRLEREAGTGGMATVYLAEDLKHRRKVAVKVLRPELAASLGATRFLREIEIAAQLSHPHILPLLDSGEADGFLYYVMPFVEGESLRQRVAREGALPVGEAVRLTAEVADALAHAHRRGVVHRDIKPDNVMLSERHALVTDFGVAKAVSEATGRHEATSVGVALGTPTYMAPEQASADPTVDHRADIYAMGAMAYELLTGRPPFTGNSAQQVLMAHLTKPPEPMSAHRAGIPAAVEQVVQRALAKRPDDRFQTADELLGALEPARFTSEGLTPQGTQPVRAVMPDRWYGHPVAVAMGYVVASAAVLGVLQLVARTVGLPAWSFPVAAALLGIGLPIMLLTGRLERKRAVARATGMYRLSAEQPIEGLFTWRKAVLGGVLAFLALALGAGAWGAMRRFGIGPAGTLVSTGKLDAKSAVLVAEFDNRTADSALGASVSEALRIDLSQSPVITVLGAEDATRTLRLMGRGDERMTSAVAREVGMRANARAVVTGEISPVGGGLVLAARLVSVADGSELVALRETAASPDQLLAALDRLSKRLRERIGESLRGLRTTESLEQVTTSSLEALRLYTQGVQAADAGRYDDAIGPLRQAVAADSTFAMAWRKLAVVLGNARLDESERVAAATKAYQLRDRLTELERYQADAFYHFAVEYDHDRIVSAYRAVLQLDPNDQAALNNLAIELGRSGQFDEAVALLERALATGKSASFYSVMVNTRLDQGRQAEALAALDRMRQEVPNAPEEALLRSGVLARMGRYDSAAAVARGAAATNPPASTQQALASELAHLALIRGRLADAERERQRFLEVAARRQQPAALFGGAAFASRQQLLVLHDTAAARRLLEEAVARIPLDSMNPIDRPYVGLVTSLAAVGEPGKARAYLEEYRRMTPPGLQRDSVEAQVMELHLALAEGRPRDVVRIARGFRVAEHCVRCGAYEEALAWERLGEPDSALAAYELLHRPEGDTRAFFSDAFLLPQVERRLGELYEAKGDRTRAVERYTAFLDLWRDADPVLQPQVREVKERLAGLVGEGGR